MIRAAKSPQVPGPGGGGMSTSQGSWSLPRHRNPLPCGPKVPRRRR